MPLIKHQNTKHRRDQNKAADERRGTARERGYSTEWDKFAKGFLKSHPLCFYCSVQGRVTASELVDHIVPHRGDPDRFWPPDDADWSDFFAACCRECHDGAKQRAERTADRTGKDVRAVLARWGLLPEGWPGSDPDMPIRSAGATVITGPPAVGKTFTADQLQKVDGGRIYDLDVISEDLGLPRYGRTQAEAMRAVQERDIRLQSHSPSARLILIVSAPTVRERLYWQNRLGDPRMVNLVEPRSLLVERARARAANTPEFQAQIEAIDFWFSRYDG